ncbi:SRPBCC domain-containing protein [Caulobacter sp.]|uniref:SRPBCC domain-containing protein n=1 Tax=Caulobacter sp. TaxID=78 RepID=UPI001B2D69FA|nr:SRPBCC domain-containing protein [Caulobacter sp.]MBO9545796.1 SRPBCC domain-containing protein [Caulobacter sp.]
MSVKFDSFAMEEAFACSVHKLFSAFTDPMTKRAWYVDGAHADTHETLAYTLDPTVGGKEVFRLVLNSKTPAAGLEIQMVGECVARVDEALLVYASRMIARGAIVSITNETFEFSARGEGSRLRLTQQGVYLDGSDGPELRRRGHEQLLAGLRQYLGG